jgi:hypothetical protein
MGIINHVTKKIKDLEGIGFKISDVKLGEKESSFRSIDNTGRMRKHTYKPKLERIENEGEIEPTETADTNPNAPVKRGRGRPKKRA